MRTLRRIPDRTEVSSRGLCASSALKAPPMRSLTPSERGVEPVRSRNQQWLSGDEIGRLEAVVCAYEVHGLSGGESRDGMGASDVPECRVLPDTHRGPGTCRRRRRLQCERQQSERQAQPEYADERRVARYEPLGACPRSGPVRGSRASSRPARSRKRVFHGFHLSTSCDGSVRGGSDTISRRIRTNVRT